MANKPKVTGLSFNIYAIVTLLVILPISTALITNLANTNQTDYESITTQFNEEYATDPEVCNSNNLHQFLTLRWLNKGINQTENYEYIEQTNDPYIYDSIWDENDPEFKVMSEGCQNHFYNRDGKLFLEGYDNHYYLTEQYASGNIPNYHGYIGYSGDEFEFVMNNNIFKFLDDNQDLKSLKLTFIDPLSGFDCSNPVFNEVSFTGDITFSNGFTNTTYSDFDFEQINSYFVTFLPSISQFSFCHISITVEFELTAIESVEFNSIYTDYDNLSAQIRLYNFEYDNFTLGANIGQFSPDIPFTGDGKFAFDVSVAYVDTVQTNLFLNGGTLILGIGLFLLAIASTPYWDPVTNFFKEGSN